MTTVRVLVADERAAAFYDLENLRSPLQPRATLDDPTATLRDRELESDRPGRGFASGGHRHGVDGERSARRENETRFAGRIAHEVERARQHNEFDRLVIMAGPRMLGLLREALAEPSRSAVAAEVPKDLAHHDLDAIRDHVPDEVFHQLR
jgi:protein required for attachment to host cells